MQDSIQTGLTSRTRWIAAAALILNVVMIAFASLILIVRLRETLVQTVTAAMVTVILLVLGKVPSMVFRKGASSSQDKLFRYMVAVSAVLVFVLVRS